VTFARGKWRTFAAVYAWVWVLYFSTNRQTLRPAHLLPLTALDRGPFLPWTGWIYVLVFVFPLAPAFLADTDEEVRKLARAFFGMATFCSAVFFLFPTVYPRPPMPDGDASVTLAVVRFFDTAKNCLPSQHVAGAFLSAFFMCRHGGKLGFTALALAVAISISTLTTKQHYAWDVAAGFLAACAAYRLS
jgi:membrane-associated phospholipid phosphatase